VPNALRRIITLVGAVALLLGAAASLSAPASAVTADAPVVSPVTPADGATVAARHVLLTWTSSTSAASYEVRWGTVEGLGPDGLIVADGSVAGLTKPRFDIPDLADLTYHWQVRAIGVDGSAGPWSAPSSFVVQAGTGEGEQLDTLAPDGAESPGEQPARTPAAAGGWAAVDGILYLVVASTFAVILLAVVARTWVRVRREA
jgi:hypothetical protein